MATPERDELEVLAGEYVLGVLGPAERAEVERRLAEDGELHRLVMAWERHLTPLALAVPPQAPPPQVWWSISRSLALSASAQPAAAAPRPRPAVLGGFWRAWSVGATLVAGILALLLARDPVPEHRLIAVLLDARAQPAWLISAAPKAERLRARPLAPSPAPDRVQELWLLPPGQQPPVSLGLLEGNGAVATGGLDPAKSRLLAPGQGIAVSLEPPGGSPTGLPTGPVVYTGVLIEEG